MSFIIWPRTPEEGKAFERARAAAFSNDCHAPENGQFCSGHGLSAEEHGLVDGLPAGAVRDNVSRMLRDRRAVEPKYTAELRRIAALHGGRLEGFDFRFKEAQGIVDKIERKVAKGRSPEKAAAGIGDSLRYTVSFPTARYVEGMKDISDSVKKTLGDFVEVDNSWHLGDEYNGVNSTIIDRGTGLRIELQFHTPESWHTKQVVNHKHYVFVRNREGTLKDRLARTDIMTKNADAVPRPKGIDDLSTLGGVTVSEKRWPRPTE